MMWGERGKERRHGSKKNCEWRRRVNLKTEEKCE